MSVLIVSILEEFLGSHRNHTESKGQISFDCPACAEMKGEYEGDGKGNLEINYEKGVFKCWSCKDINNMYGPIPKLIKRYGDSRQLKNYLLLRPEVTYKKESDKDNLEDTEINLKLPDGFKLLKNATSADWKYDKAIVYLKERGITDEIIAEYNIGFTVKGKYFNRIIIPSYDTKGQLNYFIARSFDSNTKPKYRNPDADEVPKTEIVFNEGKINWDATIYLEEGAFDHIVTPNSIPILGKYLSPKLKKLLHDKAKGFIVILLDDDAYEDAVRLYKELNFGDLYGRIRICVPPAGYDPSKIFEKLQNKGIVKLLRNSRKLTDSELDYN